MAIKLVFILLIFLKFENDKIQAQNNFSIKYFGLIVHPFGDYSARIQPYKLDKNAYFVVTIGGYASYEQFIWQDILSLKFKQGLFLDCSAGKSGVTHVSVQMNLLENKKNKLSFSIGPTLIYRESWTRFKEYKNSSFWHIYTSRNFGKIQYKFIPYGCEFEYDYRLTNKVDLSTNIVPGFPFAFTFAIGAKYWLNKNFTQKLHFAIPI